MASPIDLLVDVFVKALALVLAIPLLLVTLGLLLLVFGAFALYFGAVFQAVLVYGAMPFLAARDAFRIVTTGVVDPGDADEGVTAVEGRVRPAGDTLTAPVSGEECVAYWLRVEETRPLFHRRLSDNTPLVARVGDAVPFDVEGAGGRVRVAPVAGDADATPDGGDENDGGDSPYAVKSDMFQDDAPDVDLSLDGALAELMDGPPAPEMALPAGTLDVREGASTKLLRGHGIAGIRPTVRRALGEHGVEDPDPTERQTYTEWILRPGEEVYVLGTASRDGYQPRIDNTRWNAFLVSDSPRWRTLLSLCRRAVTGALGAVVLAVVLAGFVLWVTGAA